MFPAEIFSVAIERFGPYIRRMNGRQTPSDYTLLDFINTEIVPRYDEDDGVEEITAKELKEILEAEENADAVCELQMLREEYYLQQMSENPKNATGCIFALKQPKNGGYSDKQEVSSEKKLTIKWEGVGADAGK